MSQHHPDSITVCKVSESHVTIACGVELHTARISTDGKSRHSLGEWIVVVNSKDSTIQHLRIDRSLPMRQVTREQRAELRKRVLPPVKPECGYLGVQHRLKDGTLDDIKCRCGCGGKPVRRAVHVCHHPERRRRTTRRHPSQRPGLCVPRMIQEWDQETHAFEAGVYQPCRFCKLRVPDRSPDK